MKQDTLLSAALPAIFGACAGSTVGSTSEKGEFSVKDGALKTVSSISLLWHTPEKFSDTAVRIVACLHRALSVTPRPHRSYTRRSLCLRIYRLAAGGSSSINARLSNVLVTRS